MFIEKVPIAQIRHKYKHIKIDKKWIILALVFWIASFMINIWPILFLTIFCVANSLLLSIDRYVSAPVDLELSTFSAVVMTIGYGLKWGIAVAVLTKVAAIVYNKNVRIDHIFMILGYVIAALVAGLLKGLDVIIVGITVVIMTNLYTLFVSKFVTMLSSYEMLMYGISNFIFNVVLFIAFSQFVVGIMI